MKGAASYGTPVAVRSGEYSHMKKLMILGAGIYQVPLIRRAKELGYYTAAVSIPGNYPGFAEADETVFCNTRDREGVFAAARERGIDGICTTGTDVAVPAIAYTAAKLGLPGISEQAAACVSNKLKIREALAGTEFAIPFQKIRSAAEGQVFFAENGGDVVVKAVDSSGSRGITRVTDAGKMEEAVRDAFEATQQDYVLIEQFIPGEEIGVDGFVQEHQAVMCIPHRKFVIRSGPVTIPLGHAVPLDVSADMLEKIEEMVRVTVRATGIDACAFNMDVMLYQNRVYVLEIGGRAGGTCIPEVISGGYDFDYYETIIDAAVGNPIRPPACMQTAHCDPSPLQTRKDLDRADDVRPETCGQVPCFDDVRPCMAKLLFSPVDGIITAVRKESLAPLGEAGAAYQLDYAPGDAVTAVKNGTDRLGHLICRTGDETTLDQLLARMYEAVEVDGLPLSAHWIP